MCSVYKTLAAKERKYFQLKNHLKYEFPHRTELSSGIVVLGEGTPSCGWVGMIIEGALLVTRRGEPELPSALQ